ncbi:hypothetical protein HRR83_007521 [Exophiala dermatitidis]|uniref:Uncharacterized protein n=2 Tax=Exophiala dermatitidis TaxID=5970 RepID=H6C2S0_EXODN|nr:uncharacterized protein HMPREF1120_06797 [Exophiala dermatitidis NIH/UT8656]KAJ4508576.1 hypothetical protein HRR75_006397 [Exophiala dermatitidis]EHY58794.1 hypothetical protein HMPREF1120_06797 [Exophiala dermatitidis NIH/UT8656]KAJ4510495.1 hypothetical protein HRR74_006967 [Exophiala dermatitidis]KAJ4510570.1 hypothetical protein HRR73_006642 [Exophiala dermatitidis]KAJ4531525.1 hypothetical protein HRR77_009380 [Exophiala dermatitidis]
MSVSSSSRRYSIVEPHPSVPPTHYLSTGRGGAGNVTKAPPSVTPGSDAKGPASRIWVEQPETNRKTFIAGRGGAGNVHPASERAIFSFDEELERQLSQERHAAPVYHVGRGGAGNIKFNRSTSPSSAFSISAYPKRVFLEGTTRRRSEDSVGSTSSTSSKASESGADQFNRSVKKGFKKMLGVSNHMTG